MNFYKASHKYYSCVSSWKDGFQTLFEQHLFARHKDCQWGFFVSILSPGIVPTYLSNDPRVHWSGVGLL